MCSVECLISFSLEKHCQPSKLNSNIIGTSNATGHEKEITQIEKNSVLNGFNTILLNCTSNSIPIVNWFCNNNLN